MNGGHSIHHNRHLSDYPGLDATRSDAPWNDLGQLDLVCESCGDNRQFASEKEAYMECWELRDRGDLGPGEGSPPVALGDAWYCGECL